jgi:RNA polymerase sigma factor (sigma-70 family)
VLMALPDEKSQVSQDFRLDEATMTRVVTAEWTRLLRMAYLLLDDRATAEETVQEVCEAVWRLQPAVRDVDHLTAYLRTAVVNRTRSAGRRRATAQRHLALARIEHEPPADTELLAREDREQVRAALSALTGRQREVVVLRYWGRLSEAEIAATLEISTGTVKSTAHHARTALRAALGGAL